MAIKNFRFYNPTRVYFGEGQLKAIGREIPEDSKVLILYGGGSVKKFGLFEKIIEVLGSRQWGEFGGIEANPTYETLMKAVKLVKEENYDYLLAAGGGSVIDGTKFVAAGVKFAGDPLDIFGQGVGKGQKVKDALPFGTVLTMPATASEMNKSSVVTFVEKQAKISFASDKVYPTFSIIDPTYTYSLPQRQLANGVGDAFVHVMENYLTYPIDAKVQDRWSEGLLLTLIEEADQYVNGEVDYANRANIVWAITNALNGFASQGVPSDWSSHALGHEITVLNNTDHARTLSPILLATMKVRRNEKGNKIIQYGEKVWGIYEGSDEERIDAAIEKTASFFQSIGLPITLNEINVEEKDIDFLVEQLTKHGNVNMSERGDQSEEINKLIYQTALK